MRTILVPTDFSEPAENAAFYALNIAIAMKTDIHLCHAVTLPVESPVRGGIPWALHEYPDFLEEGNNGLKKFAKILEEKESDLLGDDPVVYRPKISYTCEAGDTAEVISDTAESTKTALIVMGMTGAGKLNRFIFGSSSIRMIDSTQHPLLIIPYNQRYKRLEKIAFSTDLNTKDIQTAQSLVKFAKYFNAELLIAHIPNFVEIIDDKAYQERKDQFLKNLEEKISYISIESDNVDSGLDSLKQKDLDMLVMGHQHKGFFDRLILGSYAERHASESEIPLMIIPEGAPVFF